MEIKKSILIVTILYLLSIIAISIVYRVNYKKLNNDYSKAIRKASLSGKTVKLKDPRIFRETRENEENPDNENDIENIDDNRDSADNIENPDDKRKKNNFKDKNKADFYVNNGIDGEIVEQLAQKFPVPDGVDKLNGSNFFVLLGVLSMQSSSIKNQDDAKQAYDDIINKITTGDPQLMQAAKVYRNQGAKIFAEEIKANRKMEDVKTWPQYILFNSGMIKAYRQEVDLKQQATNDNDDRIVDVDAHDIDDVA